MGGRMKQFFAGFGFGFLIFFTTSILVFLMIA